MTTKPNHSTLALNTASQALKAAMLLRAAQSESDLQKVQTALEKTIYTAIAFTATLMCNENPGRSESDAALRAAAHLAEIHGERGADPAMLQKWLVHLLNIWGQDSPSWAQLIDDAKV